MIEGDWSSDVCSSDLTCFYSFSYSRCSATPFIGNGAVGRKYFGGFIQLVRNPVYTIVKVKTSIIL